MPACQSALYAGVDAGASGTRCVVVSGDGSVLGTATGAAGAYHPSAPTAGAGAVRECLARAVSAAGLSAPLTGLGLGVAGVGRAADMATFLEALAPADLASHVCITHDAEIALYGAFPDGIGIVVIAGTGSVAFGRDRAGGSAVAGGWGREVDDAGGGWWLGREVLRAVARAHDGRGAPTRLTPLVLAATGCASPPDLVTWARQPGRSPREFAELSLVAQAAADAGDPEALRLLGEAASHLAALASACASRLHDLGGRVALVGGLAAQCPALRRAFAASVAELSPGFGVAEGALPAVFGAVLKLWVQTGVGWDEAALSRMADGARVARSEAGYP